MFYCLFRFQTPYVLHTKPTTQPLPHYTLSLGFCSTAGGLHRGSLCLCSKRYRLIAELLSDLPAGLLVHSYLSFLLVFAFLVLFSFLPLSDCLVIFYIYFQLERLYISLLFFNIHIFAIYLNRNIYVHILKKQTYISYLFSFFSIARALMLHLTMAKPLEPLYLERSV